MASIETSSRKETQPLPIPTFGVLLICEDSTKELSVLLVRHGEKAGHRTGMYGIPAGRQEAGETPETTAVRELREETGINISTQTLIEYPNNFAIADIPRKDGVKRFSLTVY